jgi:hypothetical protein
MIDDCGRSAGVIVFLLSLFVEAGLAMPPLLPLESTQAAGNALPSAIRQYSQMGDVAGRGKLSADDNEEAVKEEAATKSSRWLRALCVLTGSPIEDIIS